MGEAKLINLDTNEVEIFKAKDGVLHIPFGRYAPVIYLDTESHKAVIVEEESLDA